MKVKSFDLNCKEIDEIEFQVSEVKNDKQLNNIFYLLNRHFRFRTRQGTAHTKNRSLVAGGGAKPYKQKGTGNARRGTNRTPLRRGGGVIFGPQNRIGYKKQNKRLLKVGYEYAYRVLDNNISVLNYSIDKNTKTKTLAKFLKKLDADAQKFYVLCLNDETDIIKVIRNLDNVIIGNPNKINLELMKTSDRVVLTMNAVNAINARSNNEST